MKRVEFIFDQAVREDFFGYLEKEGVNDFYYTEIVNVQGKGIEEEKRGDAVWPEENIIVIAYVKDEIFEKIKQAVAFIRKKFDNVGVRLYYMDGFKEVLGGHDEL